MPTTVTKATLGFPLPERFWTKVDKRGPDECWPWIGYCNGSGHGRYFHNSRLDYAHRVMMESLGMNTANRIIRHSCDNARCVNPAHLQVGTQLENMADWHERGHGNRGDANGMSRLSQDQVTEMRRLYSSAQRSSGGKRAKKGTLQSLAMKFGITTSGVNLIVHNHRRKGN